MVRNADPSETDLFVFAGLGLDRVVIEFWYLNLEMVLVVVGVRGLSRGPSTHREVCRRRVYFLRMDGKFFNFGRLLV